MNKNKDEETPKLPRRSVHAVQVGTHYRVQKVTNTLDIRIGSMLTKEEAQNLIDRGINFSCGANR
jgi:hypothetical protein